MWENGNGKARVRLQEISKKHNFANHSGKYNALLYDPNRSLEQPPVIKGTGADVTIAGVFADIIRDARI